MATMRAETEGSKGDGNPGEGLDRLLYRRVVSPPGVICLGCTQEIMFGSHGYPCPVADFEEWRRTEWDPGKGALQRVLSALYSPEQDGYRGYIGDGRWSFVTAGLPQTTPEELNALFRLAGIVPNAIVSKGTCATCRYSIKGGERGWVQPCVSCVRPLMSNWEGKEGGNDNNDRHIKGS